MKCIDPANRNLDPDTNWPPWHPHLFLLYHYYPVKSTVHYCAEPKQSKRGWEGLKVRVGSEILVLLRKSLERWIRKAPAILSTQSLRVPKPPATPPLLLVVVPFQFGEIASSLL